MSRHQSRQQALERLFSREFHGENDIQYRETEIFVPADSGEESQESGDDPYCTYLIQTVSAHKDELDACIRAYAKHWDVGRMNYTDRNILRLALCELLYPQESLAPSIVLNEAIVLAKEYSGNQSAKFINGILGAYVRDRT
ncbi:transcription antitermination factor NusB [uncultured Megasphaera sp.]|uniref:transcription antitermination factor NusB n=1 Tax=uncultured Megasphaera sp. TaxID=165188 RepID=UPI00265A023F|nr:transcription antitermination factor NusB [uncultured Megasphaera sp.]